MKLKLSPYKRIFWPTIISITLIVIIGVLVDFKGKSECKSEIDSLNNKCEVKLEQAKNSFIKNNVTTPSPCQAMVEQLGQYSSFENKEDLIFAYDARDRFLAGDVDYLFGLAQSHKVTCEEKNPFQSKKLCLGQEQGEEVEAYNFGYIGSEFYDITKSGLIEALNINNFSNPSAIKFAFVCKTDEYLVLTFRNNDEKDEYLRYFALSFSKQKGDWRLKMPLNGKTNPCE